ncbi:hypothetical protein [Trinickia mobilis]|uniref:hypothetical protein n=1 Tax=Trinickia mobilis TaxID=2816356 RepID=UPI001A8C08E9|nr:hypothetical protein [Trinickia mobilis]
MTIEFDYKNADASFDDEDLNEELLADIRQRAAEHGSAASYLVYAADLLNDDTVYADDDIFVVTALPGMVSSAVNLKDPDAFPSVETELDGSRSACLMLAKGNVALSSTVVIRSRALMEGRLLVLWLFDDTVALCQYDLRDDVVDEIVIAGRCAELHVHLTQEETAAWQKVAREAKYVGVFDFFDLTKEAVL